MTLPPDFPERAREAAAKFYAEQRLNCAESVFKAVVTSAGLPCPLELVRMASSFGHGMGGAGCSCGSLVGAQLALGYFLGRAEETGRPPQQCRDLAKVAHDRFVKINRVACCRILLKGKVYGTPEQKESCANHTREAAEIAATIIMEALQQNEETKSRD